MSMIVMTTNTRIELLVVVIWLDRPVLQNQNENSGILRKLIYYKNLTFPPGILQHRNSAVDRSLTVYKFKWSEILNLIEMITLFPQWKISSSLLILGRGQSLDELSGLSNRIPTKSSLRTEFKWFNQWFNWNLKKKCNFILQFLKGTATCSILISLKKSKIIKCVRQNNLENRTSYGQQ